MRQCAKDIQCSPAALSQLLVGKSNSSQLVGKVSGWLKIPPPSSTPIGEPQLELLTIVEKLSPEDRTLLLVIATRLLHTRQNQQSKPKPKFDLDK